VPAPGGGELGQLRRWTGIVLLVLLVFVTVFGAFDRSFHPEPAFYGLCAALIAGIFVAEGVEIIRHRNGKDQ
jgi:hypothetical protein